MRAGGNRIDELLALNRVHIAAPLQGELFVVDAARNVRRQYDGRVDHDRRARRARPARLRPSEPSNDGGAERNAKSQDAPTSLQRPVGAMF